MNADFLIEWVPETRKFSRPLIGAELIKKGRDAPIPLRLEPATTDPPGIIEVVHMPELSSETVGVLRAELTQDTLGANDFYDRVEHPVKVEITAVPVDDALRDAIGPEVRTCTVGVDVPKPILHWRGPPFERDDAPIEVDADGEHEFELWTWVDAYRPVERDIGYDRTLIEFTHKTAKGFDPRLFGPHPDDRPWVVAPAGGANNREYSRWISKLALPHPDFPVASMTTTIHVQVWSKGAITKRIVNEVSHRRAPLLDAPIEIRLRPVALVPELARPAGPFDADGKEVGAVLRISRQRDGKPFRRGVISWEVKGEGSRGTTVRPDQVELTEADGGETTLWVTPPELTYQPFERYRDDLIVYAGAGEGRRQIGIVPLLLRPAIKAAISVEKRGFEHDRAGLVDLKPVSSACSFKGALSYTAENADPQASEKFPVRHARVEVHYDDGSSTVDLKTDDEGVFTWELPELEEVFKKIPNEREYELTSDRELPVLSLAKAPQDALAMYNDKVRGYAPLHLLSAPLQDDLKRYGLTFCGQLCKEPETSYGQIIAASELLRVGAAGATTWQSVNDKLWARGATDVANILKEGLATLISARDIGPMVAKAVQKVASGLSRGAEAFLKWAGTDLVRFLQRFVERCTTVAAHLAREAPESLSVAFKALQQRASALLTSISVRLTEASGRPAGGALVSLVRAVGDVFAVVGEAAWAAARALLWAFASTVGAALDAGSSILRATADAYEPTLRWLRVHFNNALGRKDWVGNFSFAKLMEILAGWFVEWLAEAEQKGRNVAMMVQRQFQLFRPAVEDALRTNHGRAVGLLVPGAAGIRVDEYTRETVALNTGASALLQRNILIDQVMGFIDAMILIGEASLMAVVVYTSFFTGGAAMAFAPTISKFEVVVGSLKMLVGRGLLQGVPTFWMATGTAVRCHLVTANLTAAPAP